jgi:hypothetical protein
LSGTRRILVKVTNISETRHVDPVVFGRFIADAINDPRQAWIPKAFAEGGAQQGDAILQVSIAKESTVSEAPVGAAPGPTPFVQLTLDTSLTSPDGVVLSNETNQLFRSGSAPWAQLADPWSSLGFTNYLRYYVCFRLVSHTFYGVN